MAQAMRIGEAALAIGVRVETLRRWARDGKLNVTRTKGGQRVVSAAEVARLQRERGHTQTTISAQSARNRFPGVITAVRKDRLIATVEIAAGPHRIVSLLTREAADELGLKPGMHAIAAVKSTNVIVEVPR